MPQISKEFEYTTAQTPTLTHISQVTISSCGDEPMSPQNSPKAKRNKSKPRKRDNRALGCGKGDFILDHNYNKNNNPPKKEGTEPRKESYFQNILNKIRISPEDLNIIFSCIVIILILYLVSTQNKPIKHDTIKVKTKRNGCPTKVLGLVGVQTTYDSADRRAALRTTWFPQHCDAHLWETSLAFVFVIGKTKGPKKIEIEKESLKYGDILILKESEDISRLDKTLAFFKAAYKKFDAEYYIKADDDIYLRPDRLATLLSRKQTKPLEYIGCKIIEPFNKMKNLVFARGSLYILSADAVKPLAAATTGNLPKTMSEDYAIGYLMDILSVKLEEHTDLCQSHCTPNFIAVWNFSSCSSGPCNPVTKLQELHMSSICSKTPTVQSEQLRVE